MTLELNIPKRNAIIISTQIWWGKNGRGGEKEKEKERRKREEKKQLVRIEPELHR